MAHRLFISSVSFQYASQTFPHTLATVWLLLLLLLPHPEVRLLMFFLLDSQVLSIHV